MPMTWSKALAAAVLFSSALTVGTAAPAEAHSRRGVFLLHSHPGIFYNGSRFGFPGYYRPGLHLRLGPSIVIRRSNSCQWLRHRALVTGSRYWWNRWQECRYDRSYW